MEATETLETDVLVVGAGPGGSATAYHLARHGVDVTLVDKATFPREKVCGDGLTPRAVKALWDMGIDTSDPAFAPEPVTVEPRAGWVALAWGLAFALLSLRSTRWR